MTADLSAKESLCSASVTMAVFHAGGRGLFTYSIIIYPQNEGMIQLEESDRRKSKKIVGPEQVTSGLSRLSSAHCPS